MAKRAWFVSLITGLVSLPAVVLAIAPTRASAQVADPGQLPNVTSQGPPTGAYNGLNVPGRPAGGSYVDPASGARVYRLTSGSFPTSSANWSHDYAEFGNEVSLPWGPDGTRTVFTNSWGGAGYWLFDFTPGVGVSNPRRLTGRLQPCSMSVCFTFSNNPATPYYAYVGNTSQVVRFDIRTMTEAPGDGWPVNGVGHQLAQAINDSFFTWSNAVHGNVQTAYTPSTGRLVSRNQGTGIFINRAGRYACISVGSGCALWDTETDSILWTYTGGVPDVTHGASLQGMYMAMSPQSVRYGTLAMTPGGPQSQDRWGPTVGGGNYASAMWVQPGDQLKAWVILSHYGGLTPEGWASAPGAIVAATVDGSQRRLVAHHYNTSGTYGYYSWAKFSPDGKYVMWTSNMNGSGRSDLFLAEIPVSGGGSPAPAPAPPPAPASIPAASNPTPVLTSLSPSSSTAGSGGTTLLVSGGNFTSASVVQWNGSNRPTTFVSSSQLRATIATTDLALAGTAAVKVVSPSPGGGASAAQTFMITNPVPSTPAQAAPAPGTAPSSTGPLITNVAETVTGPTTATIAWDLDRLGTGQVEYGTTTAYGTLGPLEPSFTYSRHVQRLVGLAPGTTYHYCVQSRDQAGGQKRSCGRSFTTPASTAPVSAPATVAAGTVPSSTGPMITNVGETVTGPTTATIAWDLDRQGTGQVEYGTTTAYGTLGPLEPSFTYSRHVQRLVGLAPATTYHYCVQSRDQAGGLKRSCGRSFTTPASTGPVITNVGETVTGPTTATIAWDLDRQGTGQVEYGTTTAYGTLGPLEPSFTYSRHVQRLVGLAPGTTYHYCVQSRDQAGILKRSCGRSFTTSALAAPAPAVPAPAPAAMVTPPSSPSPMSTPITAAPVTRLSPSTPSSPVASIPTASPTATASPSVPSPSAAPVPSSPGSTPAPPTAMAPAQPIPMPSASSSTAVLIGTTPLPRLQPVAPTATSTPTPTDPITELTVSPAPTRWWWFGGRWRRASGTVTVAAAISESVDVAQVQFKLDGQTLGTASGGGPYAVQWDTTQVTNGWHRLNVIVVDKAGAQTRSRQIWVRVSN